MNLGTNGNEGVLYISKSSRTGASSLDSFVSYSGHLLKRFYFSAEMQLAYSIAPANLAT